MRERINVSDSDTLLIVARIRKLLQTHGVNETARIVGRTAASISQIKNGQRHANTGQLLVRDLGVRRGTGLKCRRCDRAAILFAKSNLCVECELLELAKLGIIAFVELEQLETA